MAALGFAGCSMPSYDRALHALRSWLDSWSGIGHVTVGMARQGYDLQLTRYDEKGWRATLYTTGMEHSHTSATGTGWERTPWRAVQRAAWEAVRACTISCPPRWDPGRPNSLAVGVCGRMTPLLGPRCESGPFLIFEGASRDIVRGLVPRREHLPHLAGERVRGEGLLEKGCAGIQHAAMDDGIVRVARHIEHRHVRLEGRDPIRKLATTHPWHHDIRQHEVDRA